MPIVLSSRSKRRSKKLDADAELIAKSLKRYKITYDSEAETRKQGLEDLQFSIGTGQWDSAVKSNREIDGKPCLTVNRIPTFLRQYTGEERQHRPAMLVDPVGDGADEEVAEIIQGVLRHTEVVSFADTVYDNSYDMMLRIGWDYWRINTDYITETSFDQEPRIAGIENPFAVYMSPIRQPDGTDPLWCHVVQDLSKEEYEEKYGKSQMARLHFPTDMGNAEPNWVTKDGARIAEYWWLELEGKVLCQLEDGTTCFKQDLKGRRSLDERDTVTRKVCCVKHNAIEVLERYEYQGRYIPILELNGVRLNVNGKIYKAGMVRDARDAQRIYDFMVTRAVEQVDLQGKDPLFVPEGGNKNHEEEYRQMNKKSYPYMYYVPYDADGKPLPPPSRANRNVDIQAIQSLVQQADYDMKAVIGVYGTGPGEQGAPNESAFAVMTREQQTNTGTVNWSDNLNRTIRWQGKILIDLWPKVVPAARIQRIIKPDDDVKQAIVFNSQHSSAEDAQKLLDGKALKKVYDIGSGLYDVTMSTGPQYRTARQEGFRALMSLVSAKPELAPMMMDVLMKYADWPGAHILGERFKKMLPPNLQDDGDDDPQTKISALEAQLQAIGEQHTQLVSELGRASDTIRTKRLEIESKERISMMQFQHDLVLQEMKSNAEAAQAHMQEIMGVISHRLEVLHESMSVEEDAGAAPQTPELPNKVEPHVQPITPAAPVAPVPGTAG